MIDKIIYKINALTESLINIENDGDYVIELLLKTLITLIVAGIIAITFVGFLV